MRIASSPRLLQVGREVKEAKLREFVADDIAQRKSLGDTFAGTTYTVLARAPDSPVVRALYDVAPEIADAGILVQALFLDLDCVAEDRHRPTIVDLQGVDLRVLADLRFAAAHEQLVLGPQKLWLGDCMRRDPAKRDAFEMFHGENAAAARHAQVSFSRMWVGAKPVRNQATVAPNFVIASKKTEKTRTRPATRG